MAAAALMAVVALTNAEPVRAPAGPAAAGTAAPTGAPTAGPVGPPATRARPNVVVVTADDMDAAALAYLPRVRSLIGAAGTTFTNSVVSYSLCCPSRATFLTGQYAHNHRVLGNGLPDGGYAKLRGGETLPVWLRRAGYATGHVGKYLNGYGRRRPTAVPPGWSEWYGSVDPSTYRMWGYTLNENGTLRTYGKSTVEDPALYQTDVYARKAVSFVNRRAPSPQPFFLWFAPLAPHGEAESAANLVSRRNPRPAPRHRGRFAAATLPRPPSFDEADVSDKPAAVRRLPRLGPATRANIERVRLRGRLESLLALDEAVASIVAALRASGELDNTVLVFTSDNGWMQGEHRIALGKVVPYEESIRVPLMIRGPGFPAGRRVSTLAANVDLAPTITQVAGATAGLTQDGRSLVPIANATGTMPRGIVIETGPRTSGAWYVGVRSARWKYVEHSTGERELYDLALDPYELRSVQADPRYAQVRRALATRLATLRTCGGDACRRWAPDPAP